MAFSSVEICWSGWSNNVETCQWPTTRFVAHSTRTDSLLITMILILTPSKFQTFHWNQDHSCTGWMIECARYLTIHQKFVDCVCLRHDKHLYSSDRNSQKIYVPSKTLEKVSECHCRWHIWKVDRRTIRWDLWCQHNWLEWFSHGKMILIADEGSPQSLAREVCFLRFCVMPWKDELETTFKYCLGWQVDVVQEFSRIQSLRQKWRWPDGIRVANFPRIPYVAVQPQSTRVHVYNHLHVDVQRHLMRISRQWTGLRIDWSTRFDWDKKIFTRKMVILRIWIRKEVLFYSWKQHPRRMG